jgi:hemerythrin-like domain-containing protein
MSKAEANMCSYCGCRDIPLIKEFIAEHEAMLEAAADAAEALREGAALRARGRLDLMARQLEVHCSGEEEGLFAAMYDDPQYAAYLDELVAEHSRFRALLGEADPAEAADRARLLAALDDLRLHIAKEEDGLFPASLTALSGAQWDASMAAWQRAHPDDASLEADLSRVASSS